MELGYFYGAQASQYDFIRLPKLLMTGDEYSNLSTEAKLLYGLLLDRMGEARKNQWSDKLGRVYVVYPIIDIQKNLGVSKKKAMQCLAELEERKLIERKHRGKGCADIIYLMKLVA